MTRSYPSSSLVTLPVRRPYSQGQFRHANGPPMLEATIALLGRSRVVVDGAVIPDAAWTRRSASGLVELLALAPGRCLHREQVLDVRWPDSSPEQARPRLHTAAHDARRALGDPSSVMLHDVVLTLLPQAEVDLDVERLLRLARAAMSSRSAAAVDAALAAHGGPLLPEDLFGPWTKPTGRGPAGPSGRPARGQALERPAPARARRRAGAPGTHACSRCPWRSPRRPTAVRATGPRPACRARRRARPGGRWSSATS